MAIFMGGTPVKEMVLSRSMTSTAVAGVIEPTIWPSFLGHLRFVKMPPIGSRQWVVLSSKDTCGDAHLVSLMLTPYPRSSRFGRFGSWACILTVAIDLAGDGLATTTLTVN